MEIFDNHLVLSERENGLRGLRVINLITGDQHSVNFGEETYASYLSTNKGIQYKRTSL